MGNHYNQNVYRSTTDCKLYRRPLDNAGNPSGATSETNCPAGNLPTGLGANPQIQTYSAFAVAGTLREELWIDNKGYLRNVPLTADNTNVDWPNAPVWIECCTGPTPLSQDGYIVSRP